jgi:hypothetical protein
MANHSQRPQKERMKCSSCREGKCERCIDRTRMKIFSVESFVRVCSCERKNHDALLNGEGVSTPYGSDDAGGEHNAMFPLR